MTLPSPAGSPALDPDDPEAAGEADGAALADGWTIAIFAEWWATAPRARAYDRGRIAGAHRVALLPHRYPAARGGGLRSYTSIGSYPIRYALAGASRDGTYCAACAEDAIAEGALAVRAWPVEAGPAPCDGAEPDCYGPRDGEE